MKLEDFKSDYNNAGKDFNKEDMLKDMHKNPNPVLKGIKIQMLIETVAFSLFIALYYDFFDGHLKSPLWNFLLIVSVILILVHNILSYQIINNPIQGDNVLKSLENYLKQIRKYSMISIATRALAFMMIMGYFISTLDLGKGDLGIVGIILLIFFGQVYLLKKVWTKREKKVASMYRRMAGD